MRRFASIAVLTLVLSAGAHAQTDLGVGGGGTIFSLVYTANGILFAGCDMSGVYRSTDNGNSWFLLNQHDVESPDGHFSVAVDPAKADHLIAVHPRQGVRESNSDGADGTWTTYAPATTFNPAAVPTVRTAAISGGGTPVVLLGTDAGVYSIQASGTTTAWQRQGALTLTVVKIVFVADPSQASGQHGFAAARCTANTACAQPDGVYDLAGAAPVLAKALPGITDLAGANTDASNYVLYAASSAASISRFATGGSGWQDIPTNDTCVAPNLLGVASNAPNTIYATSNAYGSVAGCSSRNVVFKGTYTGGTPPVQWANAYAPSAIAGGWIENLSTFGWGFGGGASSFAVHPTNANIAAYGNQATIDVTVDGAATWTQKYTIQVSAGPPPTFRTTGLDVTTAWNYYHHGSRRFLAQTDIGLALSDDGAQWSLVNSDSAGGIWGNFYELAFDDARTTKPIWAAVSQQHDIPQDTQWDDTTIAGNRRAGAVLLSTSNGSSWTKMANQPGSGALPVVSVLYRPAVGDLVASVWGDGVYSVVPDSSGAAAGAWTRLGTMPAGFDGAQPTDNRHFYQLRQDTAGNLYVIVAATRPGGVLTPGALLRLAAGSTAWVLMNTTADPAARPFVPNDFTFDPSDPAQNTIYVATMDVQNASTQPGGLWKYTLTGGQVTSSAQVLSDSTLAAGTQTNILSSSDRDNAAAFSPTFVGNTLYVATMGHGIVQSTDAGATWTQAFPSLRFLQTLRIFPDGGAIYATTFGAGLWNVVPDSFNFVVTFTNASTGAKVVLPLSL